MFQGSTVKKIALLLLLVFAYTLSANDILEHFIDEQIKVEAKLNDSNLSTEKKEIITKKQSLDYQRFFLGYISEKEANIRHPDPNRIKIAKIQFRIKANQERGNKYAVLRDEVEMENFHSRQSIRNMLQEVLSEADTKSYDAFNEKTTDILIKYLSKQKPLNEKKYHFSSKDINSSLVLQELQKELELKKNLDNVVNTFSSELLENSKYIYRTIRLSKSGLFGLVYKIDNSPLGERLNSYLSLIGLNTVKIIFFITLIVLTFIIKSIVQYLVGRLAYLFFPDREDIHYIHNSISRILNILIIIFIIHMSMLIYFDFDIAKWSIQLFHILYTVLTGILIYRFYTAIASLKIEKIDNLQGSKGLKKEVINFGIKVTNATIILVTLLIVLKILGVNLTALLGGLGIGGVAVAFAAKESIANIFGSISILAGDIFEQGDWIEANNISGTVVEIGLRATTIRTFDNALISVPNYKLTDESIKNWSRRTLGRRIKMEIGVTYESDFKDIRHAIEDIRKMLKEHPGIANENTSFAHSQRAAKLVSIQDLKGIKRTTLVYMDEFSDSSIDILVYCFSRSVVWNEWLAVKEDVMFKIADIIQANNLQFAYPALTIHQQTQTQKREEAGSS